MTEPKMLKNKKKRYKYLFKNIEHMYATNLKANFAREILRIATIMSSNVFGELVLAGRHAITNRTRILPIHRRRCRCLRFRLQSTQVDHTIICRRLVGTIRTAVIIVRNNIVVQAIRTTILFAHCLPLAQILAAHNVFVCIVGATLMTMMLLLTVVVVFVDIDVVIVVVVLVLVIVVVGAASQVVMMADVFVVQFDGTCVALWGNRGAVVVVVVGAGSVVAARCGLGADVHRFDRRVGVYGQASGFHCL